MPPSILWRVADDLPAIPGLLVLVADWMGLFLQVGTAEPYSGLFWVKIYDAAVLEEKQLVYRTPDGQGKSLWAAIRAAEAKAYEIIAGNQQEMAALTRAALTLVATYLVLHHPSGLPKLGNKGTAKG
jgi:hypothetical protein